MLTVPDAYSFSHLLGLFAAGGGYDAEQQRLSLRFGQAAPFVVSGAVASLVLTAPGRPVRWALSVPDRADVLSCAWSEWERLLPAALLRREEHACAGCLLGPGHRALAEREPHAFVRGLLEAGGRRVVNRGVRRRRDGTSVEYAYPRYLFTSADALARGLLCAGCEQIGVRWTQSRPRTISVAERTSIELLDSFVGEPVA